METEKEMMARLNGMAKGDATWDLSENDMNAIGWALNIVEEKFTSTNSQSMPCPKCGVPMHGICLNRACDKTHKSY